MSVLPFSVAGQRVLFVCNEFPAPSETFISFQIEKLLSLGMEVGVIAGPSNEIKDPRLLNLLNHPSLRTFHHPSIPDNKTIRALGCAWHGLRKQVERDLGAVNLRDLGRFRANTLSGRIGYLPLLEARPEDFRGYSFAHAHFGLSAEELLFWQSKGLVPDIPFVVSFHGCDVSQNPAKYGNDVYAPVFARAQVITANSNYTKNRLLAMGAPEEKIVRLRAFVDTDGLQFQEKVWVPGEAVKLLAIGRLEEMKGHMYLIRAIEILKQRGIKVELRIAGGGSLYGQLLRQIHASGVWDRVTLLGWQDRAQVRSLLDWAHILVASSVTSLDGNTEGQGVVLQEAQASGLPVIATIHNGFPESLLPDKSGFLVPERSPVDLADAVEKLIKCSENWGEMGRAGSVFVRDEFDLDSLTRQLLAIYERLARKAAA